MKICLINPPQILYRRFGTPFVFQPLGLLYVAAVLEKEYPLEIIDAQMEGWRNLREIDGKYYMGLTFDEIGQKVRMIKPDIVGITLPFSINEISALKVASVIKAIDENIITILGGAHPSIRPLETLSSKYVDFVVVGEGEITILELIRTLNEQSYNRLMDVAGIGYKEWGKPFLTPPRALIQDLDSLPFPARHLVPMEEYFDAMKARKGAREMYAFNERWTSIITSRGCPHNCNFCSIHLTMGRKFRARSPENVISEIKLVTHRYNIKHINFEDDNLTLNKKRAELIFDLMIKNKFDVTWSTPNGIRADTIDEELVRKMRQSGCKRVVVAPESGVQRVVTHIIGKNLNLRNIENAILLFKRYNIIVDGSFVIGLIGETKKEIWKTIRYALRLKKLGIQAVGLHIATPYYGTKLYEEAKQKGFLRKDLDDSLFSTWEPLINTPHWNISEIRRLHEIGSWLINNDSNFIYLMILQKFPIIWPYLKYVHKILVYLLKSPRRFYHWLYYYVPLVKDAFVNITLKATHRLPKLKCIVYEVTDACNSRCQHCYIWKHKPTKDILTAKEIERMLSKDIFSNLKTVLLTGGEPVLRDDITELIATIHKVRPKAEITLSTNALLPERVLEVIQYAITNNICLNIGVSLDAVGVRHDSIRRVKGNFEKANYLLQKLINLKEEYKSKIGTIGIGHTLSNLTADTLNEVLIYAQQLKVGFLTQLHEEFVYYHNANEDKNNNIENYKRSDNSTLITAIKKLPPSFHNEMLLNALKHKLRYRCAAMRTFFVLRCNGSLSPCLRYSDVSAGNVKSHSFQEIWHSESSQALRKLVENCHGCSNSWATSWSFEFWFPSFCRQRIAVWVKNLLYKLKNLGA